MKTPKAPLPLTSHALWIEYRILKYPLTLKDIRAHWWAEVEMSANAQILSLQLQNDVPTLWVQVRCGDQTTRIRRFRSYMTGEVFPSPSPHSLAYLATLQFPGDEPYVLHFFEDLT